MARYESSSSDVASVVVSWLPSRSDAAAVEKQAVSSYLPSGSFKADDSYSLKHRFAVAGVPGAGAALFGPAPSKAQLGVAVAVFPEGRYVAVDFVHLTSAARPRPKPPRWPRLSTPICARSDPGSHSGVTH